MDQDGARGTTAVMLVLAHTLEANMASYNSDKRYQVYNLTMKPTEKITLDPITSMQCHRNKTALRQRLI